MEAITEDTPTLIGIPCQRCANTGDIPASGNTLRPCPSCKGTGVVRPPKTKAEGAAWGLTSEHINELQVASIDRVIARAKAAHFVDIAIRINGKYEHHEADWIKHLARTDDSLLESYRSLICSLEQEIARLREGDKVHWQTRRHLLAKIELLAEGVCNPQPHNFCGLHPNDECHTCATTRHEIEERRKRLENAECKTCKNTGIAHDAETNNGYTCTDCKPEAAPQEGKG